MHLFEIGGKVATVKRPAVESSVASHDDIACLDQLLEKTALLLPIPSV